MSWWCGTLGDPERNVVAVREMVALRSRRGTRWFEVGTRWSEVGTRRNEETRIGTMGARRSGTRAIRSLLSEARSVELLIEDPAG